MDGFQTTVRSATVFGSMSRIIRQEAETVGRGWCSGNQYGSFCRSVACPHYTGGLVTSKCNTLNCGNFMSLSMLINLYHALRAQSVRTKSERLCRFVSWPQLLQDLRTRTTIKSVMKKVTFVRKDPM
jgi:hypothetical protein